MYNILKQRARFLQDQHQQLYLQRWCPGNEDRGPSTYSAAWGIEQQRAQFLQDQHQQLCLERWCPGNEDRAPSTYRAAWGIEQKKVIIHKVFQKDNVENNDILKATPGCNDKGVVSGRHIDVTAVRNPNIGRLRNQGSMTTSNVRRKRNDRIINYFGIPYLMKRLLCEIGRCVDWVLIRGCWTLISVMSRDLSSGSFREMRDSIANREVILMIPDSLPVTLFFVLLTQPLYECLGNPVNDGLYADLGQKLLRCLLSRDEQVGYPKRHYLFHMVSYVIHEVLRDELRSSGKNRPCERFKLDDQVQHKHDFAREHLPKAQKAYVLGHSIGAYMMLRLLPYMKDDSNVKNAMGLFPTVEKMSESPNGVYLEQILTSLQ
uniref:Lipid droplet-associated hydrolase n=1 Tax=Angiostrongylus costaricensis TaxID=334426 RepID=A0A0R3Q218_ANGCS